jgi:hypothetical protein
MAATTRKDEKQKETGDGFVEFPQNIRVMRYISQNLLNTRAYHRKCIAEYFTLAKPTFLAVLTFYKEAIFQFITVCILY